MTRFWKIYHLHLDLHTNDIIISNFALLWLYVTCKTKFISAMILVIIEGILSKYRIADFYREELIIA